MMTKYFSADYILDLSNQARNRKRLRQHANIHQSYQENCQRLFNALEPGSYIRPHRHAVDPREELLVAIRGRMAFLEFDDGGQIRDMEVFGTEKYGVDLSIGLEISPETWHTVIALEPGSVLLEVKAGPFDPARPKELAPWAPEESSIDALGYLNSLLLLIEKKQF